MSRLKVPTLQHLARNWTENPERGAKVLVNLVRHPPTFSYNALYGAVRDRLLFGVSEAQVRKGIELRVGREDVRKNFLEILPLIFSHFKDVQVDFVQGIERRYYNAGRGLMVPFEPPLVFKSEGKLTFPWFSFWKNNPLDNERLSLFATLVYEVLEDDPDLEAAKFLILDFSAPPKCSTRRLRILNASEIPRVSNERKNFMLEVFAEAFFSAQTQLASSPKEQSGDIDEHPPGDDDQPDLFT